MEITATYDELMREVERENILRLSSAIAITTYLATDQYEDYEEDYSNSKQRRIRNISEAVANESIKYVGTEDDFHNLSVAYARFDMYDCACKILFRGLKDMPYSVDLLADYIKYGLYCGEYDLCKEYFGRLQTIPQSKWNWRAYSFSIDYLLDRCNRETGNDVLIGIQKEATTIANAFIKRVNTDQAYFDKSTVYRAFGEHRKEHAVLLGCLNTIKVAPKSALRLADIEFENGNFKEAILYTKRCISTIKPQPDVSQSYAYLLFALGKASDLFTIGVDSTNFEEHKEAINDIYRDLHTSIENGLVDVYRETANTTIRTIAAQTGIEYPYNNSDDRYDF
jgi:tetratricopeptide (TPR) repeat protein